MTQPLPPKSLVLYADDDPDDRDLLRDAFSEYYNELELVTFENGEKLLAFLKNDGFEHLPCLIILDINMPGMGGKQVLKTLRNDKKFEELPVVLFTTSTLPSETEFAQSYGAGFITKPLHWGQIQQIVDKLIDHCTPDHRERIMPHRKK